MKPLHFWSSLIPSVWTECPFSIAYKNARQITLPGVFVGVRLLTNQQVQHIIGMPLQLIIMGMLQSFIINAQQQENIQKLMDGF